MYRHLTEDELYNLRRGAVLTYKEGDKIAALEFLGWGGTCRTGALYCLCNGKQFTVDPKDSHLFLYEVEIEHIDEIYDYDS